MNAPFKLPEDLSKPTEEYVIQNRTQKLITIKDPTNVSPRAALLFADGPVIAHVKPRAEGIEPWWVFRSKGNCGLSRKDWLRLRDDDRVEIRRLKHDGTWEELDGKEIS